VLQGAIEPSQRTRRLGLSYILWTDSCSSTLKRLLHLTDRWALDGRDPDRFDADTYIARWSP
jgi:hypothetical protein